MMIIIVIIMPRRNIMGYIVIVMSSSGATYRGRCSEGGDNYVYDIVKDSIATLVIDVNIRSLAQLVLLLLESIFF